MLFRNNLNFKDFSLVRSYIGQHAEWHLNRSISSHIKWTDVVIIECCESDGPVHA